METLIDIVKWVCYIGLAIGGLLLISGPKADKRYKTGYKNNEKPDPKTNFAGLVMCIVFGGLLWLITK